VLLLLPRLAGVSAAERDPSIAAERLEKSLCSYGRFAILLFVDAAALVSARGYVTAMAGPRALRAFHYTAQRFSHSSERAAARAAASCSKYFAGCLRDGKSQRSACQSKRFSKQPEMVRASVILPVLRK
jgi:hypothetical protein